jgi:hypothetical protein
MRLEKCYYQWTFEGAFKDSFCVPLNNSFKDSVNDTADNDSQYDITQ